MLIPLKILSNMEKEFIPYKQALALKELGFNEPCFYYFNTDKKLFQVYNKYKKNDTFKNTDDDHNIMLSAPLYQQAFRWFRGKYDLVHTIYSNASGYMWELHYNQERGGTHICDSGESGDCEMSGMFTTYEKAELECLKKLILIVKNGK